MIRGRIPAWNGSLRLPAACMTFAPSHILQYSAAYAPIKSSRWKNTSANSGIA